jgi:glycosyltransferase involved in cell wall biosynthesis
MKVLFSCPLPFFLAHGGSQTLVEALMRELAALDVEVEPVRWWDENQTGDIIHSIGRPIGIDIQLAHEKGFKVVMTELLDQAASRSALRLFLQRMVIRTGRKVARGLTGHYSWGVYQEIDAMVYAVPHQWDVAQYLFDANPQRGHVISHGLEEEALTQLSVAAPEEDYLVSAATIHPRKNTLLLAQAAHLAKVPIVFLGKPYSPDNDYFLRFKELVDGKYVRYPGFVSAEEKYRYLRGARGFGMLSMYESGCISVYEAAAAGLPLFLPNLSWASKSYPNARNLHLVELGAAKQIAPALKRFYNQAHRMDGSTFPVLSWRDIAREYLRVYEKALAIKV